MPGEQGVPVLVCAVCESPNNRVSARILRMGSQQHTILRQKTPHKILLFCLYKAQCLIRDYISSHIHSEHPIFVTLMNTDPQALKSYEADI